MKGKNCSSVQTDEMVQLSVLETWFFSQPLTLLSFIFVPVGGAFARTHFYILSLFSLCVRYIVNVFGKQHPKVLALYVHFFPLPLHFSAPDTTNIYTHKQQWQRYIRAFSAFLLNLCHAMPCHNICAGISTFVCVQLRSGFNNLKCGKVNSFGQISIMNIIRMTSLDRLA